MLEAVLLNAFSSCDNLEILQMLGSRIKELPSMLFSNNKKIQLLEIKWTPIENISDMLFSGLSNLNELILDSLHLTEFPVEALSRSYSKRLDRVDIYNSYLRDLHVELIVWLWPNITRIGYDDNDIKCNRVEQINAVMKANGKVIKPYPFPRSRSEPTETRDEIVCLP